MKQKTIRKYKSLHSYSNEGVQILTECIYTPATDHVYIRNAFRKQNKWHGGAATNPKCTMYLGIIVAEQVLSEVFDNVQRMTACNKGFDFVCGGGHRIDVKSSCLYKAEKRWIFIIKHNTTADYFLLLAFDNRDDLNPQHLWLIPGSELNHLHTASIAKGTLYKWKRYELNDKLEKVIKCCNAKR